MTYRQYRPNERARQTGTFLGALRYGFAGADSDTIGAKYDSRWDRTASKAAGRGERLARKLLGEVDAARDGVAAAEAKLRCAKGADKPAARRALRDAKDARDRAKRAARKAGLQV